MSRMCAKSSILLAFVVAIGWSQTAAAGGIYGGKIDATFSNPVFQGSYLNTAQVPVYLDTTSTAVVSIVNNGNSAEIIFGDNSSGSGAPSTINFFGSTFVDQAGNQEFNLGTLTYSNGASSLTSLIYGATLTLSVENDPSILPVSVDFRITTTQNGGFSAYLDADYITFPSPINVQFHVYEGAGATADVIGGIFGDPYLGVTSLANPSGGGTLTAVPEPGSLAILAAGLVSVGVVAYRKRRNSV